MIPHFDTPPPCSGWHALFDSRDAADHRQAKALCQTCPAFDACAQQLEDVLNDETRYGGSPEGTWAGQLYGGPLTKYGAAQLRIAARKGTT